MVAKTPYWLAFAILFAFSAALLLPIAALDASLGSDEGVYRLVAREMAKGSVLYNDIWDNKPPYLYWIYLALLEPLNGETWLLRLFGAVCFALMSTAVFAVFHITTRRFDFSIAFALIFLCALQPLAVFNATLFEAVFLLLATGCLLLATCQVRAAQEVLWVFFGGFLAGLAFGFKPTAAFPTFLLVLGYLVFRHGSSMQSIRLGLASIVGWLVALVPAVLVCLAEGAAESTLRLVWENNVAHSDMRSVFGSFHKLTRFADFLWEEGNAIIPEVLYIGVLAVALAGIAVLVRGRWPRPEKEGRVSVDRWVYIFGSALFTGGIVESLLGGGFQRHYWTLATLGAGLIVANALAHLARTYRISWTRPVGASLIALLLWYLAPNLGDLGKYLVFGGDFPYPKSLVTEIAPRKDALKDKSFLALGYEPHLVLRSGADIYSAFPHGLFFLRDRFPPGARGDRTVDRAWARLAHDMRKCPPNVILLEDEFWQGQGPSVDIGARLIRMAAERATYERSEIDGWLILRARDLNCEKT
jgi:hypothetical protein